MSPRTTAQYEALREARAEDILRAARAVFATKGFVATKIADIAAAADVSYGLVYHYFPTKEAVFATLVETALRGAEALIKQALEQDGTPWQRLRWLCAQMLAGVGNDPEWPLLIVQAYTSVAVPDEVRTSAEVQGERALENTVALIRQAQQAGQAVTGDPRELALVFMAMIQGLALGRLQQAHRHALPQADTVLRLLKA